MRRGSNEDPEVKRRDEDEQARLLSPTLNIRIFVAPQKKASVHVSHHSTFCFFPRTLATTDLTFFLY